MPKHSNIDNIIYLDSVENFCDMTEDNLHDTELPTKQNLYCDQRSTWEVSCSLFQIFSDAICTVSVSGDPDQPRL